MGTLFSQDERNFRRVELQEVDDFLGYAKELASKHKIDVKDVIAAKHALEIERANHLSVDAGNILDEQLAGFGEILKDIHEALSDIAEK